MSAGVITWLHIKKDLIIYKKTMVVKIYKNLVKAWRCKNRVKQANILAVAIKKYEGGKITINKLTEIFYQLSYK